MFVWNFRWGWVNLWEVVRSVFRGPRHMQKSLFCKSTPEQPFEQTQLIAGNVSPVHPFQPFLMPPHDTENTVSECWWFWWAESLWMASDDVIFVFKLCSVDFISHVQICFDFLLPLSIVQLQLLHLCNQHASISAEWIVLTIAAIQSLAIVDNLEAAGERTRAWIRYSLIHMLVWIGMCHICTNKLACLNNLAEYI